MFAQEPNIIAIYVMYVLYKLQADNILVLNPLKLNNEEISKYLEEKNTDLSYMYMLLSNKHLM